MDVLAYPRFGCGGAILFCPSVSTSHPHAKSLAVVLMHIPRPRFIGHFTHRVVLADAGSTVADFRSGGVFTPILARPAFSIRAASHPCKIRTITFSSAPHFRLSEYRIPFACSSNSGGARSVANMPKPRDCRRRIPRADESKICRSSSHTIRLHC